MANIFDQVLQGVGGFASGIGGAFNTLGNDFQQGVQHLGQDYNNWSQQQQSQQQQNNIGNQQAVDALKQDFSNFMSGAGNAVSGLANSYVQSKQADWNRMNSPQFWDPNSASNQQTFNQPLSPAVTNIPVIGGFANGAMQGMLQGAKQIYGVPYDIANEIKAGTTGSTFEGTPYDYSAITSGPAKYVQNMISMAGGKALPGTPGTTQAAWGGLGEAAMAPLMFAGGEGAAEGAKGIATDALSGNLLNTVKQIPLNFIKNAPIGFGFGLSQGLSDNANAPSVGAQLQASLPGALAGGALTGTIGAASPVIGQALSKYVTSPIGQRLISKFGMDGYDLMANKDLINKAMTAPETMTPQEKVAFDALNGTANGQNKVNAMLQELYPTKFDRAGNLKPNATNIMDQIPDVKTAIDTNKVKEDYAQSAEPSPAGISPAPVTEGFKGTNEQAAMNALNTSRGYGKEGPIETPAVQLTPKQQMEQNLVNARGYGTTTPTDIAQQVQKTGGITVNKFGNQPTEGYAYAPSKGTEVQVDATLPLAQKAQAIDDYKTQHTQELQDPNNHLGIWVDNGIMYLDVSRVGPASPETLAEAAKNQQLAVYDLKSGDTIYTDYGKTTNSNDTRTPGVENVSAGNSPVSGGEAPAEPITQAGQTAGFTPEVQKELTQAQSQGDFQGTTPKEIVPNKSSILDKLRSSNVELQHMGTTGTQTAQALDDMLDRQNQMAGKNANIIVNASKGLDKGEIADVNRALDGQKVQLNPAQQEAFAQKKAVLQNFGNWAQDQGLEITRPDGTKVPWTPQNDYFPREIDTKALSNNRQEAIDYLTNSGQIADSQAATNLVDSLIKGDDIQTAFSKALPGYVQRVGRMGNLEFSRALDLPKSVYNYGDDVLSRYVNGASRRLSAAEHFGPNNEKVQPILDQISKEGGNAVAAKTIIDQNLGITPKDTNLTKSANLISDIEGGVHTTLAGLRHIANIANTITREGPIKTFQGIIDATTPEGQKLAADAGVVTKQVLDNLAAGETGNESGGGLGGVLRKVSAPFINQVMTVNRTIAANAVKRNIEDNVARLLENPTDAGANNYLKALGMDPQHIAKNGGVNSQEVLDGVQEGVKSILGRMAPLDKPELTNTPIGRLAFMFKSYPFFQAGFVNDNVLQPLRQGNVAPLLRYMTVTTAIGAALNAGYHTITGTQAAEDPKQALLSDFMYGGGFGLPGEALAALAGYRANGKKENQPGEAMSEFLTPAVVSDLESNATAITRGLGGDVSAVANQGLRDLPGGGYVANRLFPSNAQASENTLNGALSKNGINSNPSGIDINPAASDGSLSDLEQQQLKNENSTAQADITKIGKEGVSKGIFGFGATSQADLNARDAKISADKLLIAKNTAHLNLAQALNNDGGIPGTTTQAALVKIYNDQGLDSNTKKQLIGITGINPVYIQAQAETKIDIPAALSKDGNQPGPATYTALTKIYDSKLNDATKQAVYSAVGVDPKAVANDALASKTSDEKITGLYSVLKGQDHQIVLNALAQGRTETISGKMLTDSTTLNGLVHKGLISKEEYTALNKIHFDSQGNDIGSLSSNGPSTRGRMTGSQVISALRTNIKPVSVGSPIKFSQNGAKMASGIKLSKLAIPTLPKGLIAPTSTSAGKTSFKLGPAPRITSNLPYSIYQLGYPASAHPLAPHTPPRDIYTDGGSSYGARINNSNDQSYGGSEFGSGLTGGV